MNPPRSFDDVQRIEAGLAEPQPRAALTVGRIGLPDLTTVVYVKELGTAILVGAAILYLLSRTLVSGPMRAGRELATSIGAKG